MLGWSYSSSLVFFELESKYILLCYTEQVWSWLHPLACLLPWQKGRSCQHQVFPFVRMLIVSYVLCESMTLLFLYHYLIHSPLEPKQVWIIFHLSSLDAQSPAIGTNVKYRVEVSSSLSMLFRAWTNKQNLETEYKLLKSRIQIVDSENAIRRNFS